MVKMAGKKKLRPLNYTVCTYDSMKCAMFLMEQHINV